MCHVWLACTSSFKLKEARLRSPSRRWSLCNQSEVPSQSIRPPSPELPAARAFTTLFHLQPQQMPVTLTQTPEHRLMRGLRPVYLVKRNCTWKVHSSHQISRGLTANKDIGAANVIEEDLTSGFNVPFIGHPQQTLFAVSARRIRASSPWLVLTQKDRALSRVPGNPSEPVSSSARQVLLAWH